MKVQELNPSEVLVNPAILARKERTKSDIAELVNSYVQRRESGQIHQIQPGIVRSTKDGYELIAGLGRLRAAEEANAALGKDEEPFLFHAIVVRDKDVEALETSITENEKRKPTNIFERASAMQALLDLGRNQDQVAAAFGLDKSTVSQTLAAGKLPLKLQKMVLVGDMEQDAALLLATISDQTSRNEIIEECVRHRNFYDEMEERIAKQTAKSPENGEATEDPEEKPVARTKKKSAKKSKIRKEDVARAAKQNPKTAATKAAGTSSALTRMQFFAHLDALYKDKDAPLPKSAKIVISAIQAFMDGEISAQQFRGRLLKAVGGEEQAKAA